MDQKTIISNVMVAVVTAVILGILGFFGGVFEKGATAMSEDQIEAVLKRVLITDAGKTYAARISEIDGALISVETRVGILQADVSDLEKSLLDLASE